MVHSPEERRIHDPDVKPQQVAVVASSVPAAPVNSCKTDVFAGCPKLSIQSETSTRVKDKDDAAQTAPTTCGRALILRPADQTSVNDPLTVTRCTKKVQTSLESTTFNPSGRTVRSVHLMLASEQQIRPDLTLKKVQLELASNPAVESISIPLPKQ